MQFTKLFESILDSTIWQESPATKVLWVTMLAMSDRHGEIHAAIPGLAKRAGITLDECKAGLESFLAPDEYSRTTDHEGRRIEEIDGGWRLLNHAKYRALLSKEERKEYNRRKQAEYRAKKKAGNVNDVSMTVNDSQSQSAKSTHTEAEAEAEADSRSISEAERESAVPGSTVADSELESFQAAEIPPCTIEQAKAHASTAGILPEAAETWWHDRDSVGWEHKGQTIRNWHSNLTAYGMRWKSNESKHKQNGGGRRRANAPDRSRNTLNNPDEYK